MTWNWSFFSNYSSCQHLYLWSCSDCCMFVLFRPVGNSGVCFATSAYDGLLGGASLPVDLSLGVQVRRMQNCHKRKVGDKIHHVVLDSLAFCLFKNLLQRLKSTEKNNVFEMIKLGTNIHLQAHLKREKKSNESLKTSWCKFPVKYLIVDI